MTSTTTGPDGVGGVALAERGQRGLQPRHADREAGRRHVVLHEAADQPVVAPAAADRAEARRLALLVDGLEQQLRLEDGAGVVFKAAHDRRIDADAVRPVARRRDVRRDLVEFGAPLAADGGLGQAYERPASSASSVFERCRHLMRRRARRPW